MKKRLGFALVEMLVVIGAISALSAIAYPSVDKGFEKGRESRDITAMHSADSLMTSAALTGRIIDGKPAKDYTGSTPLFFDGDGNLTSTSPAPYGKGTVKGAGEIWSCCDDYQYNPNGDYTNGYIYCWYDPATRVTHVHWSSDSAPGDSGSTSTTPPKYDDFPTRPTETEPETTEPTTPTIPDPKEDPIIIEILGDGHPYPETESEWSTVLKPGFVPVMKGHRYRWTNPDTGETGTYLSVVDMGNQTYAQSWCQPSGQPSYFIQLNGTVYNSIENCAKTTHDGIKEGNLTETDADGNERLVTLNPGDLYVSYELRDGKYVAVSAYVCKIYTTAQNVPTMNGSPDNWVQILFDDDCPVCGIPHPKDIDAHS